MKPVMTRHAALTLVRILVLGLAVAVPPALFFWMGVTPNSRILAWTCSLLGMLGLLLLAGWTVRDRALGILVDERNRYSLSRLQVTLWTVLVIGTVYTVFASNLIVPDGWKDALNLDMDLNLVLLMGFSLASFTVAPLALSLTVSQAVDGPKNLAEAQGLAKAQKLDEVPETSGGILVKQSPKDARLADFVRGEKSNTATTVDLLRTQMLIISIVAVLAYGGAVVGCLLSGGAERIKTLPTLSNTLLMFILISHGGYLAGKLVPPTGGGEQSSALAGRALAASQRAAMVATDMQTWLATLSPEDARHKLLEDSMAYAQGTAAEAAALAARTGSSGFEADKIPMVEGKVEALQASLQSQRANGPPRRVVDAPSPDLVRAVQQRLGALGHAVSVTGVPDAGTEQAIGTELAKAGIKRSDLHPAAFRYYEELAQVF